jgi:hypothetical protein
MSLEANVFQKVDLLLRVKDHQDIDIAIWAAVASRNRAEHRRVQHAAASQLVGMRPQRSQYPIEIG